MQRVARTIEGIFAAVKVGLSGTSMKLSVML